MERLEDDDITDDEDRRNCIESYLWSGLAGSTVILR